MNFNPDQPRDEHGRWTEGAGGKTLNWIQGHEKELLIGAGILSAGLLASGTFVASGAAEVAAEAEGAGASILRATTMRRFGPFVTKPLTKLNKAIPDKLEGWQYWKGALTNLPEDAAVQVGRPVRDLRVGMEAVKGKVTTTIGAAKPNFYDQVDFQQNKYLKPAGTGIGIGAPIFISAAVYANKKRKR